MSQWEYAISTHPAAEIASALPDAGGDREVVYCDSAGKCFFDEAPNPYVAAIVDILNQRGKDGWILVQVVLRRPDMICFWRREIEGR